MPDSGNMWEQFCAFAKRNCEPLERLWHSFGRSLSVFLWRMWLATIFSVFALFILDYPSPPFFLKAVFIALIFGAFLCVLSLGRQYMPVEPDGGHRPHKIALQTRDGAGRFIEDLKDLKNKHEVMLVLRQIKPNTPIGRRYSIETVLEQVQKLDAHVTKINANAFSDVLQIKWVCLEKSNGEFYAYQMYEIFQSHIKFIVNSRYVTILNMMNENDFMAAIDDEIHWSGKGKIVEKDCKKRSAVILDAIQGFQKDCITEGISPNKALAAARENKWDTAMLVKKRSKNSIGVVSVSELLAARL